MTLISALLLHDFKGASEIEKEVSLISIYLLSTAVIVASIIEYIGRCDFFSVIRKFIIACIVILSFSTLHKTITDISLDISSSFLEKYGKDNVIIRTWDKVLVNQTRKNENKTEKMSEFFARNVSYVFNDICGKIIWILSLLIIFLLKQLYSFVYHFTYIFYPVCAVLSLFPVSDKALSGAIKSTLWCVLMPFVFVIMIALIGNMFSISEVKGEFIVSNISELIQLLSCCIMLIVTPFVTYKLIDGSGFSSVASGISKMGASAVMLGGAAFASKKGTPLASSAVSSTLGSARNGFNRITGTSAVPKNSLLSHNYKSIGNSEGFSKPVADFHQSQKFNTQKHNEFNPSTPSKGTIPQKNDGATSNVAKSEKNEGFLNPKNNKDFDFNNQNLGSSNHNKIADIPKLDKNAPTIFSNAQSLKSEGYKNINTDTRNTPATTFSNSKPSYLGPKTSTHRSYFAKPSQAIGSNKASYNTRSVNNRSSVPSPKQSMTKNTIITKANNKSSSNASDLGQRRPINNYSVTREPQQQQPVRFNSNTFNPKKNINPPIRHLTKINKDGAKNAKL